MQDSRRQELQKMFTPASVKAVSELRDLMRKHDRNEASFVDIEGRENVVNWFATDYIGFSSNYNSFGVDK